MFSMSSESESFWFDHFGDPPHALFIFVAIYYLKLFACFFFTALMPFSGSGAAVASYWDPEQQARTEEKSAKPRSPIILVNKCVWTSNLCELHAHDYVATHPPYSIYIQIPQPAWITQSQSRDRVKVSWRYHKIFLSGRWFWPSEWSYSICCGVIFIIDPSYD